MLGSYGVRERYMEARRACSGQPPPACCAICNGNFQLALSRLLKPGSCGGFSSLRATGPRMESYNWKAKPISPCLGAHEAHPKTTLYGVVFQKLNGPLLTSAQQSPPGSKAALR